MEFFSRMITRFFASAKTKAGYDGRAGPGVLFSSLEDSALGDFLRGGAGLLGEGPIDPARALRNSAVYRCVGLIAGATAMLPLHLIRIETKEKATDHPLFSLLYREPNAWQSAYDFKMVMQIWALIHGNAYARIVRSDDLKRGVRKTIGLVPLDPTTVTVRLDAAEGILSYEHRPATGGSVVYQSSEVFHLRGPSLDGVRGLSPLQQAADAVRLALDAELAVRNVFRKGTFAGGVLEIPGELSQEAYERLRASWEENYGGAENAGATPLLEGGAKYSALGVSPKDIEANTARGRQIEEIARVFGVPRPLLMMDETSWGSGIDVLGQFFVRYALGPWFVAWEQAISRSLLEPDERDIYAAKFNAGALIRGSMKDQGEFFARALGSGGHIPWMTANEVRDLMDQPRHAQGDALQQAADEATPAGFDDQGGSR